MVCFVPSLVQTTTRRGRNGQCNECLRRRPATTAVLRAEYTPHRESHQRGEHVVVNVPNGCSPLDTAATFFQTSVQLLKGAAGNDRAVLKFEREPSAEDWQRIKDLVTAVESMRRMSNLRITLNKDFALRRLHERGAELEEQLRILVASAETNIDSCDNDAMLQLQRDHFSISTELDEIDAQIEQMDVANRERTKNAAVIEVQTIENGQLELRLVGGEDKNFGPASLSAASYDQHITAVKNFVNEVIVSFGLCPYTSSADVAATGPQLRKLGIVPGSVLYDVSGATSSSPEVMLCDFFTAAQQLLHTPDQEASTTLLVAPYFGKDSFREVFSPFSMVLTDFLQAIGANKEIGLVLFHP